MDFNWIFQQNVFTSTSILDSHNTYHNVAHDDYHYDVPTSDIIYRNAKISGLSSTDNITVSI